MKFNRNIVAAILAGLLALGAVACETDDTGEDPLLDDGAGTPTEPMDPTPTDEASPTP